MQNSQGYVRILIWFGDHNLHSPCVMRAALSCSSRVGRFFYLVESIVYIIAVIYLKYTLIEAVEINRNDRKVITFLITCEIRSEISLVVD